jgi:hypothetical protein
VEASVNQCFKRQGRSWNPEHAERLMQLKSLMNHERAWTAWWQKPSAFKVDQPP